MKKIFYKSIPLLFAAVFFTGCLEVNTTIHLNNDGSGTLEERVLMSSQVVQMINAFASSFDSTSADSNKFSLFKEDQLKTDAYKYGNDVKYINGNELKENGKEGYIAVYSFKDINELKINENPNSKINMEGMNVDEDSSKEFLDFDFTQGQPSLLKIKTSLNKEKGITNQEISNNDSLSSDLKGMDEFVKLMRDMRITLKIDFNGNITSTNASYVDGSEVTLFDVEFNGLLDNPEKLKKFKQVSPGNIEEIKELMKDIPGIKVELNNEINVNFE